MKKATITYTKNNLSQLLGMVREGETILVMDRQTPVAQIEPVKLQALGLEDRRRKLAQEGAVALPQQPLDAERLLSTPVARVRKGRSVVATLLKDREESP